MSFLAQESQTAAELARMALAELAAPEPTDDHGAGCGWVAAAESARDPANAPAMRPGVRKICHELARHPALSLHCSCKRFLGVVALGDGAIGAVAVSSPRRLPKGQRQGGALDFAPIYDGETVWTLLSWERSMREDKGSMATAWCWPGSHPVLGQGVGVIGDAAKRLRFRCERCGAVSVVHNVTLLRLTLQAIANGNRTMRLAPGELTP